MAKTTSRVACASSVEVEASPHAYPAEGRAVISAELPEDSCLGRPSAEHMYRARAMAAHDVLGLGPDGSSLSAVGTRQSTRDAMNPSAASNHGEFAENRCCLPAYQPPSLRESSARLIKTATETMMQVVFGRRVMVRRGKRRAKMMRPRARECQAAAETARGPVADEPTTESERNILATAISQSLRDRTCRAAANPCSCGCMDHSGSSCIIGL